MNPGPSAHAFLTQHHRRTRGALLLWSAAGTLTLLAWAGWQHLGWAPEHSGWTLAATGLPALLLAGWFWRGRQLAPGRLAQSLDQRWGLRARLESTWELGREPTAWATAVEDEAARALSGRRPPGIRRWRAGQAIFVLAAGFVAIDGAALAWRRIFSEGATPAKRSSTAAEQAATERTVGGSTAPADAGALTWLDPEPEIMATAIEEVPLTALVVSREGYRSVTLETIVNGEVERIRNLDTEERGASAAAGEHRLEFSLYLDELDLKPFDIVSYRLVAELEAPGPTRVVRSVPQIVQIRPPQRDTALQGSTSDFVSMLFELKARQLLLIKQNAVLAQMADNAERDPTWSAENRRVAAAQRELATRTTEVWSWALTHAGIQPVVLNLKSAVRVMREAARKIEDVDNLTASKSQQRALALLVELEQFIGKALTGSSTSNPIAERQAFVDPTLPARGETPAGRLEDLAKRQAAANARFQRSGEADGATAARVQQLIADDAATLASRDDYATTVHQALAEGRDAAAVAARQLGDEDPAAARVPAAQAELAFDQALAVQDREGRNAAAALLLEIRAALNEASRAGAGALEQRLAEATRTLREAALQQQRVGSAEAAADLWRIADLFDATGSQATSSPAARAGAGGQATAQAQVLLSDPAAAESRVLRGLGRAVEVLSSAGEDSPDLKFVAALELISQEAAWVTSEAESIARARAVAARLDAWLRAGEAGAAERSRLGETVAQLAGAIERGRSAAAPALIGRLFDPAEVDPKYREAVETYFERLSREGSRPVPPGEDSPP